jgi:Na+-transporting methylmalonyl-CoA/oxaloacetate decarboxylase gamma subunit
MTAEMGKLALVGILIVFGVLSLIALVVALLKKLDDRWQDHEVRQAEAAVHKDPTIDNTTLVLISAAAAVAVGGRFRVRRIRRLLSPGQKRTPWSAQGRLILQGSHGVRTKRDKR